MVPPPALIWNWFEAAIDGRRKCKFCNDTENNSKNAENHLKFNHDKEFKTFENEKAKSPSRKRKLEPVQINTLDKVWKPKSSEE